VKENALKLFMPSSELF